MSYRIHRAMGFGMPLEQFTALSLLPGGENDLHRLFAGLSDVDLTVDRETQKRSFDTPNCPPILNPRLLAKHFVEKNEDHVELGRPEDLFQIVETPDTSDHVMFFPNLDYARRWSRWDDDLDYQFEAYRAGSGARGSQAEPRDFHMYLGYGPYPFTNFLMLKDGTPTPWNFFWEVEKHPEWLAAVPSEIRWYLTTLGVLDDAGVNRLRPLMAQWC